MGRYPPWSAHPALPAHLIPTPLYYILRTRNSTGWSVRTQSLAPDQSTMIIQRRISSKKTTNVWTAKTHYYALRTDFHFLCRGLRTGIFYTVMPIWYWIFKSRVQKLTVELYFGFSLKPKPFSFFSCFWVHCHNGKFDPLHFFCLFTKYWFRW